MKNIAVILAGGSGSRLGGEMPKQFIKIAGKMIIEHTIDVFEKNNNIDEIAVVINPRFTHIVEDLVVKNEYTKVKKILQGGKERYHSSLAAINAYGNDCNLIFHDAVRPLVNNRIIDDCVEALRKYEAIDVAVPTTDTIVRTKESFIDSIPPRPELRNGQTPQCFRREIIKQAYDLALQDPKFQTTDDCGVVFRYMPDTPIYIVRGEVFNMKVTYQEDVYALDKFFQLKSISWNKAISIEAKQKLRDKVMVVFGGSYGIGEDVVTIARDLGAKVYSFSRSQNGIDVSDISNVERALKQVFDEQQRIDYVVDTAGILIKEPIATMEAESIALSLNTNLLGVINVAKSAYQYLKASKGSLLFYTSSSYTRGRMLYSVYSATKAAIVNFVQALSEEWFTHGIRVNCVNPERTHTPMRTRSFGIEPLDTLLDPKDVAVASINTLASSVTGEVIDVKREKK